MATHYRLLIKGSDVKREVTHISLPWTACCGWTIPFILFTWLNDQDVCVPSPFGLLPSSYSQFFVPPDVVTWLAPTCDVVNTYSAPTAFRRLCYWLMLVPFSLSMPSPALFTTISYGGVRGHRSITSSPGLHMTAWHFALCSAKILHLFWAYSWNFKVLECNIFWHMECY